MSNIYSLSSLKFAIQINCVNGEEPIQAAYDVNNDGKSDIYVCDRVLFGKASLLGKNITINASKAVIDFDGVSHNFTVTDGILFSFDQKSAKPFFVGDVNDKPGAEIVVGDALYEGSIGKAVILDNNLHNGNFTTYNTLNNDTAIIKTITGNDISDNQNRISYRTFGRKINNVGDINNDGISDIVNHNTVNIQTIATFFYGNNNYNNTPTTAAFISAEQGFTINFHYPSHHIPNAVDLDGDGYLEILITCTRSYQHGGRITGTDEYRYPTEHLGKINIFFGKPNHSFIDTFNMSASQGIHIQTPNITQEHGWTPKYPYFLDTIKDHTGNGFGKILAGSPNANNNTGMVRLINGRANLTEISLENSMLDEGTSIFYGENIGDEFGSLVKNIGDINNDNIPDFAICAAQAYNGKGACYIFYGKNSWPKEFYVKDITTTDGFIIKGDNAKSSIAGKIVPLGDIDGDGFNDFALSSVDNTRTYIISGNLQMNQDYTPTASVTKTLSAQISKSATATISVSKHVNPDTATSSKMQAISSSSSHSSAASHTSSMAVQHKTDTIVNSASTNTESSSLLVAPKPNKNSNFFGEQAAEIVSVTNAVTTIARVSPTTMSQGPRIKALDSMNICNSAEDNIYEFDKSENPLSFISIFKNFGNLEQAAQVATTHAVVLVAFIAGNFAVNKLKPDNAYYPSIQILPILATLSSIAKAGSLLATQGEIQQKLLAIPQFLPVIFTGYKYYSFYKNFNPIQNDNNNLFFHDSYNNLHKFFLPTELIMNFAVGIIPPLFISLGLPCIAPTAAYAVIYTAFSAYITYHKPYANKFENAFAISLAVAETVPIMIKIIQESFPYLKENELLNTIKDTIPTFLETLLIAKTGFDLFSIIQGLVSPPEAKEADPNTAPLLNLDTSDVNANSRDSSHPRDHTIIEMDAPTNPLAKEDITIAGDANSDPNL